MRLKIGTHLLRVANTPPSQTLFLVLSLKKNITCFLYKKNSSFLVSSSIFSCWRQLTYQWSFAKFPTRFIVDFQPWKETSIHSHNSVVSTTKFKLQEFTFCMKLPSKELSICNHIFLHSSMEIYKFKAIISIKLL